MKNAIFALWLGITGQAAEEMPETVVLEPISYVSLERWGQDDIKQAVPALKESCNRIAKLPSNAALGGKPGFGDVALWQKACKAVTQMERMPLDQAQRLFEGTFTPYRVKNNRKVMGLFTGYYEPALRGSTTQHGKFQYPLYRLPNDITPGKAYFSRKEIEQGALRGKGLELAYVDDPVTLFFLHIQGSGRILLEDGRELRVGYAGKNNHPYIALGKVMIDRGYIPKEKMSATAIKQWLYHHREEAAELMDTNPSYVFFRELPGKAPVGAEGVELTASRSLAVDKNYLPYGVPVWLETAIPTQYAKRGQPFHRLMVAQDTGGAIKGPVRGDIFFGYGQKPERLASYMQGRGSYAVFLPVPPKGMAADGGR